MAKRKRVEDRRALDAGLESVAHQLVKRFDHGDATGRNLRIASEGHRQSDVVLRRSARIEPTSSERDPPYEIGKSGFVTIVKIIHH